MHKKRSSPLRISSVNVTVTFSEEIPNGKLHFLSSVCSVFSISSSPTSFYFIQMKKFVPFLSHPKSILTIDVFCFTLIQYLGSGFSRGPISGVQFFLTSASGSGDGEWRNQGKTEFCLRVFSSKFFESN